MTETRGRVRQHELDLSHALVRIEKLAAEGPTGEELIELKEPLEFAVKAGAKGGKGVFKFDDPGFGKGKLKLKVKDDVLEAKLKLRRVWSSRSPWGARRTGRPL